MHRLPCGGHMFGWFKVPSDSELEVGLIPWSDEYLLGIATVDEDHRNLFNVVNHLYRSVKKREGHKTINATFDALSKYVQEHFAREEQLMDQIDFPGLEEHKRLHAGFIQAFFSTKQSYNVAPRQFDFDGFLEFLRNWLVHHVIVEDRKYVRHVMQDDT